MTMRRLSPTANLLRTSRLFSLPPPLPRPINSDISANATTNSDTSTLPHPIHAAIETTESALGRGDWGLKRPLPVKSTTRSSTPHIYIENVDSIDHVIDFGSAADHTRTLEKWQEMNLSLSTSGQHVTSPLKSVFESDYDNTEKNVRAKDHQHWRFQGPFLAGQTHGEFAEYVDKRISTKRSEFREYLREFRERVLTASRRRELIESGESQEELEQLNDDRVKISDEELEIYLKHLRNDEESLNKLIEDFLDLPRELVSQRSSSAHDKMEYRGPPSTHPSAGLTYLRSHSYTVNHPLYGPQENKPPVKARVLHPQFEASGFKRPFAVLGIGGVTTADSKRAFDRRSEKEDIKSFDPDTEGGGKVYVQLRKASISPGGRIELGNQRASENALYALGVDETPRPPPDTVTSTKNRSMPDLVPRTPRSRNTQGYGLEDLGGMKASERPLPFSEREDVNDLLQRALQTEKPNQP